MLARETAEQIRRQHRAVTERFIETRDEGGQKFARLFEVERFVTVRSAERIGDELRVACFVERRIGKSDAESVQLSCRDMAGGEGSDGAGINTAAEENAKRNVGH